MMKKFLLLLSVMMLPGSVSAQIVWEKGSLRDAINKAKVYNRKIFLDFYTTWCSTCMQLDKEVFQREIGASLSKEFVCLRMDAEAGEGKEFAAKFNVISYPTVILLDREGMEIDRILNYDDPSNFMKLVFDYAEGKGVIASIEEKLATDNKNIHLLFSAGEKYAFRGEEIKANRYLGRVVELDAKNSKGYSDRALYTLGKFLYLRGQKNYNKAILTFNELDNQFPESPLAKQTDLDRAKAFLAMKKEKDAFTSLQNYLLKNKSDTKAKAYNSYAWFCYQNEFHVDDGIKVAQEGVAVNPKADFLYDTLASLYMLKGETDRAISAIRKAIETNPKEQYYKDQLVKFQARKKDKK
jgi:tetratricopeptide (TPR) repeat protein